MEKNFHKQLESNKKLEGGSLDRVWDLIAEFQNSLRNLKLNVIDRNFHKKFFLSDSAEAGIPVISDGLDGARVSFKKGLFEKYGIEKDGFYNLKLWFTNGLEKPDNEIRQTIQSEWDKLLDKYFKNNK